MRQDEIWDSYATESYDILGTGMFAPEALGPTVDCLVALAGVSRLQHVVTHHFHFPEGAIPRSFAADTVTSGRLAST